MTTAEWKDQGYKNQVGLAVVPNGDKAQVIAFDQGTAKSQIESSRRIVLANSKNEEPAAFIDLDPKDLPQDLKTFQDLFFDQQNNLYMPYMSTDGFTKIAVCYYTPDSLKISSCAGYGLDGLKEGLVFIDTTKPPKDTKQLIYIYDS